MLASKNLLLNLLIVSASNAATLTNFRETSARASTSNVNDDSYCQASKPNLNTYLPLKDSTLLSVHLMTRHGDRVPSRFLPLGLEKDPWFCPAESSQFDKTKQDRTFIQRTPTYTQDLCGDDGYCSISPLGQIFFPGNCTRGQLTSKGSQQHYELGGALSDIYIKKLGFLDENWELSNKDIHVRSTESMRTQQSATSLISGMFRNSISSNTKLPIYTMSTEIENLVTNTKMCPKAYKLEKELKTSPLYKQFLQDAKPIRSQFENVLGSPILGADADSVGYFVNVFQARYCNNFPDVCKLSNQKECITKSMSDQMMNLGENEYLITFRDHPKISPNITRLRMGLFLLEVKRNLLSTINDHSGEEVIQNSHIFEEIHKLNSNALHPNKKFILYSAHDSSIAPLLGAIQSQTMNWPGYAANFIFELWNNPSNSHNTLDNYRLRLIYNGNPISTTWCDYRSCPVNNFLNYLDQQLGVVGGFENYGPFKIPSQAPPVWNYIQECQSI